MPRMTRLTTTSTKAEAEKFARQIRKSRGVKTEVRKRKKQAVLYGQNHVWDVMGEI